LNLSGQNQIGNSCENCQFKGLSQFMSESGEARRMLTKFLAKQKLPMQTSQRCQKCQYNIAHSAYIIVQFFSRENLCVCYFLYKYNCTVMLYFYIFTFVLGFQFRISLRNRLLSLHIYSGTSKLYNLECCLYQLST
jgi:hypothetical protein